MARRKLDVSFGAKRVKPEEELESGLPPEARRRTGRRDFSAKVPRNVAGTISAPEKTFVQSGVDALSRGLSVFGGGDERAQVQRASDIANAIGYVTDPFSSFEQTGRNVREQLEGGRPVTTQDYINLATPAVAELLGVAGSRLARTAPVQRFASWLGETKPRLVDPDYIESPFRVVPRGSAPAASRGQSAIVPRVGGPGSSLALPKSSTPSFAAKPQMVPARDLIKYAVHTGRARVNEEIDPKRAAVNEALRVSIAQEGVREPVKLLIDDVRGTAMLSNGNHRVNYAYEIDPDMMVPVEIDRFSGKRAQPAGVAYDGRFDVSAPAASTEPLQPQLAVRPTPLRVAGPEPIPALPAPRPGLPENAPKLRIKPSPDDVNEVMQSNTTAGRVVGNRTRNIDELTGGVSQAADDQRRVDALVKEMSSPNGYISRLIVDDAGNVIEGQHRLEALRRLGVKDIPVTEYKDFERDIDFPALKDAIRSAQPMHSDNVNQLAARIAETYADEGGNLSEIAQYEAPKGFEQGWQAGIDALSVKPTESSLSVTKVPATAAPIEEGVDLAAREALPSPKGIIAYHGSPYSFERFDISKVGTGEGAQAYGHGLYFAEAEPVAAEYRQRLANVTAAPFDIIGIPPKEWNAALMFARQMDPTQPDVAARDFAQWVGRDVTPELVDAFRVARDPGNMYQVKLNVRPEDLLDWDRPISTQSDIVQRAAREADIGHLKPGSKSRVMMDWFREGTEQPHNLVKGRDLMMALDQSLGNNFTPEVSSQLSQFGIPGIRYLDEKSRPLGEGTRNYVMFDDALIDLLRKYAEGGYVS